MVKKVKDPAWRRNTMPNQLGPTENFAENQVTREGRVFREIAKPTMLSINPIFRRPVIQQTSSGVIYYNYSLDLKKSPDQYC